VTAVISYENFSSLSATGLTPSLLSKFDSCMPHLQRLNMQQAFSASCYEVLFSKNTFVNLQQLILCGWGFTAHKLETLFHVKRKLEVLNADEASNTTGMHTVGRDSMKLWCVRHLNDSMYVGFFGRLRCCENLRASRISHYSRLVTLAIWDQMIFFQ
uniref:Uncharacterized protein n=1 Tax=Parascaris univalens TaxID=6257 RepID=A0A915AW73_PARUN